MSPYRLHRAQEVYGTPNPQVQQGVPARIGRVFRDEEELPASADLSKSRHVGVSPVDGEGEDGGSGHYPYREVERDRPNVDVSSSYGYRTST